MPQCGTLSAMSWVTNQILPLAVALIVLPPTGCRRSATATDPPVHISPVAIPASHATSAPASNPTRQTYQHPKFKITITYPGDWKPKPSNDYELLLEPANGPQGCTISVDIPDLPPHIPGMIPISRVYGGYLDDLKKQWTDVKATVSTPTIPQAKARLAVCTGKNKGTPMVEHALLMVHSDHVYILRATGPADADKDLSPIFDSVYKSLQWK